MESLTLKTVVAHGSIALFGAIVHAAKAYRTGQSRSFLDFFLLTIMSSFSGVMFALLGLGIFGNEGYLTLMMAGTGGFLGVEGMTLIAARVQEITNLKPYGDRK